MSPLKTVPIWVFWDPDGRVHLPGGLQYSTTSRWPHQKTKEEWEQDCWSVVLTFELPPDRQGSPSKGLLRFLVEEAPHDWLKPDGKLQLYEGPKKVADVLIVG